MKGIIFSREMVKALLEGRKDITRRPMKPALLARNKPRYKAGETVYVKETYSTHPLHYRADNYELQIGEGTWHSPRFMPEWAARIVLKIKSVRAERLWDITEEEAHREGFNNRDEYFTWWEKRYHNVKDDPWVWRIEFEVVK